MSAPHGAVRVDRGIRYARAARFRLPVAEPRGADRLSAPAPQPGVDGSEDCLHLTVWAAVGADTAPVLVWIHGGAHVSGSASDPVTDGARLAATQGLVVVAVQYRLGALGHLLLEDPFPDAANAALHDQLTALRWVHENIGAYGGDPASVTVMGQSAGGVDALALLSLAAGRSLLHRVIAHSCTAERTLTPTTAAEVRDQLVHAAGVPSAQALRDLPVTDLIRAQTQVIDERAASAPIDSLPFRPVVDGALVQRRPLDALAAGEGADVPLLIGSNRREALPWMGPESDDDRALDALLHDVAPRLRVADLSAAFEHDHRRTPTARRLREAVLSELMYRSPVDRVVRARGNAPTFAYVFDPVGVDGVDPGHSGELPLVFGTAAARSRSTGRLSRRMMNAWGSFARDGRPSSEPDWSSSLHGLYAWTREPRFVDSSDAQLRATLAESGAFCERL